MGKEDDVTPMSNQFMEFRFDKIDSTNMQIVGLLERLETKFNNHITEDAIVAERLRVALVDLSDIKAEKKSNAGLWAGVGGAASGAGAFVYALLTGGK